MATDQPVPHRPTRREIERITAEIRAGWSEKTFQKRACAEWRRIGFEVPIVAVRDIEEAFGEEFDVPADGLFFGDGNE